jgi:hypothetical protein
MKRLPVEPIEYFDPEYDEVALASWKGLTADMVRGLFHYDPLTGHFFYKRRSRSWFKSDKQFRIWNRMYPGKQAGRVNPAGAVFITIREWPYQGHWLAWLWMTGEWPPMHIDHINHSKSDNRWSNLRSVSNAENHKNLPLMSSNKSGVCGVHWDKKKSKWTAIIKANRKVFYLGNFDAKADAVVARKKAEQAHGFHPNHGKPSDATYRIRRLSKAQPIDAEPRTS